MAQNFIAVDRDQVFLLPPSIREWLPPDHLAWFVIDAVAEMNLAGIYGAYRPDGHGRPAYDPAMMVTLILYSYSTDRWSSRAIERGCRQDVAYRVITGNNVPDHATIARFVVRHEQALGELFGDVLGLCERAGLVKPEVIAVDGTRLSGNASPEANRDYERLAREIIEQAKLIDEAEDELYGEARGDELPEQLQTPEGRRAFFDEVRRERDQDQDQDQEPQPQPAGAEGGESIEELADLIREGSYQGREGWLREGRRRLEQRRREEAGAIPRSREERIAMSWWRLEEEHLVAHQWNDIYERYRASARDKRGRRLTSPPKPVTLPDTPAGKVNVTDPDSRQIKTNSGYGWVQGYNAQTVVGAGQIVLAAEVTNSTNDWSLLGPMVSATLAELERAGVSQRPQIAVADTGYWREQQIDEVIADQHIQVLIPPDGGNRTGPRPGWTGGRASWMRQVLSGELGSELYKRRKQMIEPVFGHTKHNRGFQRFRRRGLRAVRTEWRLQMATHNLTSLHRHQIATAGP